MKGAHYMYIHMYQKTIIFVINYLCVCVDRPYVCVFLLLVIYMCVLTGHMSVFFLMLTQFWLPMKFSCVFTE